MERQVDFSLYTNQWDCLLNVQFSGIIIIIILLLLLGYVLCKSVCNYVCIFSLIRLTV